MNDNSWFMTTSIRVLIVGFWVGISILFLFLPNIVERFYDSKSITVLTWPTLLDTQKLAAFEQETGIKVNLRYFESNEELFAKLKETKGVGYDLIMPTDYMVDLMIKEGLLKKIEKTKLTFFNQLYPHLVGNYYDPNNAYSVPFFWGIYGIAINKDHFGATLPQASWSLIFDPAKAQQYTSVVDEARELILMAAQYLYGNRESLNDEELAAIKKLLLQQKKWVEVYTEDRANYLLASKECPVAVLLSAVVARVMRHFKNIDFLIPEQGSFLVIDSFVMPITTKKDDLIYQFLNYIYKPEVLTYYIEKYGYFSPISTIPSTSAIAMPTEEQLKKTAFLKNIISKKQMSDIWIALKS